MNELPYDIGIIRKLFDNHKIIYKAHATRRMIERNISRQNIKDCIMSGEIIEVYYDDKPFPSCLIFGYIINNNPLHVVCSVDNEQEYVYIITTYKPNKTYFDDDNKTRRSAK